VRSPSANDASSLAASGTHALKPSDSVVIDLSDNVSTIERSPSDLTRHTHAWPSSTPRRNWSRISVRTTRSSGVTFVDRSRRVHASVNEFDTERAIEFLMPLIAHSG
jgi:hypothetical protein